MQERRNTKAEVYYPGRGDESDSWCPAKQSQKSQIENHSQGIVDAQNLDNEKKSILGKRKSSEAEAHYDFDDELKFKDVPDNKIVKRDDYQRS